MPVLCVHRCGGEVAPALLRRHPSVILPPLSAESRTVPPTVVSPASSSRRPFQTMPTRRRPSPHPIRPPLRPNGRPSAPFLRGRPARGSGAGESEERAAAPSLSCFSASVPRDLPSGGASGDPVNTGGFQITCLAHDRGAFPGGVVFGQGTGPKYVQAHRTDCPL